MKEYADISIDENGDEYVSRIRQLDTGKHARLSAKKRANYRPVERKDATINPLTQRRGPESITISKNKVTITTTAVDLSDAETREAAMRNRGLTTDAIARAVFNADIDPDELTRLRAIRDDIIQEHPLP